MALSQTAGLLALGLYADALLGEATIAAVDKKTGPRAGKWQ